MRHIFFAGQLTGVEGYMESVASGLMAGINLARRLTGEYESPAIAILPSRFTAQMVVPIISIIKSPLSI